jgi:hypothetical protein
MTLHMRRVDDRTWVHDGDQPLHVPAGWQIADGSADDVRVSGAHPWQSVCLVFANGDAYATSSCDPSRTVGYMPGDAQFLLFSRKIYKNLQNPDF